MRSQSHRSPTLICKVSLFTTGGLVPELCFMNLTPPPPLPSPCHLPLPPRPPPPPLLFTAAAIVADYCCPSRWWCQSPCDGCSQWRYQFFVATAPGGGGGAAGVAPASSRNAHHQAQAAMRNVHQNMAAAAIGGNRAPTILTNADAEQIH